MRIMANFAKSLSFEQRGQLAERYAAMSAPVLSVSAANPKQLARGHQLANLTLVADTNDGPVPLFRMGSGENWVGYHVLAHLALHKWFRLKTRPVPGFIIFDQPSQANYPPENDAEGSIDALKDEDQTAVQQLFRLMAIVAEELAPHLQIIVLDHADLKQDWYKSAVVERWRKGEKLIPASWID
jgi:hypothetical protein